MSKISNKYNFILYIFILLVSLSFAFLLDIGMDYKAIYTSFLLFFIGVFVLFRSGKERFVFTLSFVVGIVFLPLYSQSYITDTGFPFIQGGDAQTFYEKVVDIAQGDLSQYWGRYKVFLFIVSKYYNFINFIGVGSYSPYHFFIFSIFCGAVSTTLTYLIGLKTFNYNTALKAAVITSLFPILIKYNLGSLREVYALPFFLFAIYQIIIAKKKSSFFILISVLLVTGIRVDWGALLMVFLFFYYASGLPQKRRINIYIKMTAFLFIILVPAIYFFINNGLLEVSYYSSEKLQHINEYTTNNDNSSLTGKLKKMGLTGRLLLFFYVIIVPLPPLLANYGKSIIEPLLTSIGSIFWYFSLLMIYLSVKKSYSDTKFKKFTNAFIALIFFTSTLLAFTSVGVYRHKLFIYPLSFLFLSHFTEFFNKTVRNIILMQTFVVILVLILLYTLIK